MLFRILRSPLFFGTILALSQPLMAGGQHPNPSKYSFSELMGDSIHTKQRIRRLPSTDRKDLKLLSTANEKNLQLLKKPCLYHIPHQMHLIWIGPKPFPDVSIANVRSFQEYHPDWAINFWTDSPDRPLPIPGLVRRCITDDYFQPVLDLLKKSNNYGETSDLLRFVIMFKEGGLYFDHDASCLRDFSSLADHYDFVAACERVQYHEGLDSSITPAIGLFLSRPGHPILKKSIALAHQRWDDPHTYPPKELWRRVIYRTFDSFAHASKMLHNTEGNRDLILPTAYFYPNFAFKIEFVKKLEKSGIAYSLHDYQGAWK